jgi:hypothetical protein
MERNAGQARIFPRRKLADKDQNRK